MVLPHSALSQWRYASNISLTLCRIYLHWRKDVVLASKLPEAFPSSLWKVLNKFNVLALDQPNEEKLNQISSLKQEYNVQNMAVIGIWH